MKELEQEVNELNVLINKGVTFSITYNQKERKLFKTSVKKITKEFTIKEPTLAVLDLISHESVKFHIDEDSLKENTIQEGKILVKKHAKEMARIVAIAVQGEGCFVMNNRSFDIDNKSIDKLQYLFYHTIKPSDLYNLCAVILSVGNIGSFLNSMRLTSGATTTKKIDIDGQV
jgi:hypothetical protein